MIFEAYHWYKEARRGCKLEGLTPKRFLHQPPQTSSSGTTLPVPIATALVHISLEAPPAAEPLLEVLPASPSSKGCCEPVQGLDGGLSLLFYSHHLISIMKLLKANIPYPEFWQYRVPPIISRSLKTKLHNHFTLKNTILTKHSQSKYD